MIYQHPLAYLIGMEGIALLRSWHGDFDERFVRARLEEVRRLVEDDAVYGHPGVRVRSGGTSEAYRQWAGTYDEPGNELLELDLPVIDALLDRLPVGVAVDTACGTGRLARRLATRGHRVIGVDNSSDMLQRARASLPDPDFLVGDLHHLPLQRDSADLLTNALALTHVADLAGVFSEFARVLRPGGAAIVSDVHPELVLRGSVPKAFGPSGEPQLASYHRRSVCDYLRAALAAGFRVRGCDEVPRSRSAGRNDPERARELGSWQDWPWTLLDCAPEASSAAWDIPSVLVWHFELEGAEAASRQGGC